MLVRFVLENMFSFGKRKEFTTIPNSRLKTLNFHIYSREGFEVLKLSSIYGANGSGKSNLIKSLDYLKRLVTHEDIPFAYRNNSFKFTDDKKQVLVIEFIQNGSGFLYGLEIEDGKIVTEELYISGLGKKDDLLLFERKMENKKTQIKFSSDFEKDEKSKVIKEVLIEEFVRVDKPILKLLANRENENLREIKNAFAWFEETLQIITPDSKPVALAHRIDKDNSFKEFAEDLMRTFNIGIKSLYTEKTNIHDFFGQDNSNEIEDLITRLEKSKNKIIGLRTRRGEEIIVAKEGDDYIVKTLELEHVANNLTKTFSLEEESDGTVRLLDFVPAFKNILFDDKVIFVDEIERSIHPLLIKELIRKFSEQEETKGQLIFTTHESNLLDQSIFRQDEIWFSEKDFEGATDIYSLSDFKEHKTIDIRKGYLNGRYGSIPFLSNLKDLNWVDYDINQ
ncbi:abortive phage resistance protein-like protein [Galbibacter marinus]|uniref:Abortive phage resistance protein-like protein n=2 Tax=Galbibacter marinus TaxID=555500 RepID=K2PPC5_9FLAO|nr:abortive phage resistance protein-like protein [Galbibacter marinus]